MKNILLEKVCGLEADKGDISGYIVYCENIIIIILYYILF